MRHALRIFASLSLAACTDDPAPQVTVVSATPDHLDPADDLADDVTIRVEYEDADGDLGGGTAEIYDCRDTALLTRLSIPDIASDDRIGEHIRGSLDLYLTDIGAASSTTVADACTQLGVDALAAGTTAFCIKLVDVAEHEGPGDCTTPITLAP